MATERVIVRMSRSDPSISWALSFGQRGQTIYVNWLNSDGLSSKAGVQVNDEVVEICGRKVSLSEAENILRDNRLDINIVLSRKVTSHTCLPWALTEKSNVLPVDHFDALRPKPLHVHTSHSPSSGGFHNTNNSYVNSSSVFSSSSSNAAANPSFERSIPVRHVPSGNLTSSYSSESQARTHPVQQLNHSHATNGSGSHAQFNRFSQQNPSFNNSHSSQFAHDTAYKRDPTTIPVKSFSPTKAQQNENMANKYYTASSNYNNGSSNFARQDNGSRPTSRLSDGATIQHLQYNSPMNLYSAESAAEQYEEQTGRPAGVRGGTSSPAYLTSETRKLIAQREAGQHGPSHSHQSPCFERISAAYGTN